MIALNPVPKPIDTLLGMGAADAVALEDRAGTLTYAELEANVGSSLTHITASAFAIAPKR